MSRRRIHIPYESAGENAKAHHSFDGESSPVIWAVRVRGGRRSSRTQLLSPASAFSASPSEAQSHSERSPQPARKFRLRVIRKRGQEAFARVHCKAVLRRFAVFSSCFLRASTCLEIS